MPKDYGELKQELRRRVLERLDYGREQPDEEVMEIIDQVLLEEGAVYLQPVSESYRLRTELFCSLRRLDILQSLVEDPEITEIMINGPNSIFIERAGRLQELDMRFESEEKLQDVIQQIVAGCNRAVNAASPIVDARLSGGARVNIVMNPVALNGPIVTIRRFPDTPITMEELGITFPRGGRVFKAAGAGRIQYFHQRRNRQRKDHFSQCAVRIYT